MPTREAVMHSQFPIIYNCSLPAFQGFTFESHPREGSIPDARMLDWIESTVINVSEARSWM
jgi:hypothetical protein